MVRKPRCQTQKLTLHKMLSFADLHNNEATAATAGTAFFPELGQDINAPIPAAPSNQNRQIIIIRGAGPVPPPSFLPNNSNKRQGIIQIGEAFAAAFGSITTGTNHEVNPNFSITASITTTCTSTTIAAATTTNTEVGSNDTPKETVSWTLTSSR